MAVSNSPSDTASSPNPSDAISAHIANELFAFEAYKGSESPG